MGGPTKRVLPPLYLKADELGKELSQVGSPYRHNPKVHIMLMSTSNQKSQDALSVMVAARTNTTIVRWIRAAERVVKEHKRLKSNYNYL